MSLKVLKEKYSALLLFFIDYRVLLYCFTILSVSICSAKLLEDVIFFEKEITKSSIIHFLLPPVLLVIFFIVSYKVFLRVNFFGTFVKILLLSLFLSLPLQYLNYRKISRNLQKVQGFTSKNMWITGVVLSQEKKNTYLFDSNRSGLGKSLLRFQEYPVLHVGQECRMNVNVVEPSTFDDFDYKKYLFRKGIYSILEVKSYQCTDSGNRALLFRYRLESLVIKALPEPEASLLIGIMFGSKRVFREDFKQVLSISGVSHIVSASGYNIALVVEAIERVTERFSGKRVVLLKIFGIWLFCIFSGLTASLLRATVMLSLYLLANFLGRESNKGICLLLCITVLLMLNPFLIHDVGFLFSFVCTTGLIFFTRCFQKIKRNPFLSSILPTLTCLLFSLPLSLIYFKKFSIVSLLSNSIAVPIVNSTIFWGLGSTLLNMFFDAKFLYLIPFLQLNIFKSFVQFLSRVKMFECDMGSPSLFLIIYLFLFFLSLYRYPVSSNNYYLNRVKQYEK
ncbi:ComEC family competence protein [Candidatus Dojkabacteria bacterium]|uniref:ComEC family competence protein n=1 Tax=Candidatus Dojkabacteria bacterium TaxID=2099670 RepID=A0A847VD17_9BACT|nr:ComEC family competence protein [Candidatus Dojkabacteria bacterium]